MAALLGRTVHGTQICHCVALNTGSELQVSQIVSKLTPGRDQVLLSFFWQFQYISVAEHTKHLK